MTLLSQNLVIVPTPSLILDGHFPDGNDGSAAIPLTWAVIPSYLQKQEGTPFSVNVRTTYLTEAGSPNATITLLSGTLPSGWTLSSAGVLAFSGTGVGSATIRVRATRNAATSDSNFFTVESLAVIVSADNQSPTIPTGLVLVSKTATTITVSNDAPSDVPTATIPADGMKEIRYFKGGVFDAVTALTGGLTVRLSKADITAGATGASREFTPGTIVALAAYQRTQYNGIPHTGAFLTTGPSCLSGGTDNVKGFLVRKTWGLELEKTPGVFDISGISKELADCAAFSPKKKLWVMTVVRTFNVDTTKTFTADMRTKTAGTLSASTANGTYDFVFSNGDHRIVTVTGNTHAAWSGAITNSGTPADTVTSVNSVAYSSCPLPSDITNLADIFTSSIDGSRGWQSRRWDSTVLNRYQAMLKGIAALLKLDPNYDRLAGICTQETSTGSPGAGTGYDPVGFGSACMLESDYISAAFPTKRHKFFFNSLAGTTNTTFNTIMTNVLNHLLGNGAVVGFPDLVMLTGSALNTRNALLVKAYHDAGGFTCASIQSAEWNGGTPGDNRTIANLFAYGTGAIADDNGNKYYKVDSMIPDWHTTGSPNFATDGVPVISSAAYAAPYGTISVPSVLTPGTVVQSGKDYTVTGYGSGIGNTSDEWTAARIGVNGNFTMIVKLNAVTGTDVTAAQAGISIREPPVAPASDASSRVVHLVVTTTQIRSRYRAAPGAAMSNIVDAVGNWSSAKWLKIKRTGNVFTFFYATTANTWIALGTVTLAMASSVYAELFSTSVGKATAAVAAFQQVNIQNLASPTRTYTGLTTATSYDLTAKARDQANNDSAASDTLTVVTS